MIFFTFAIAVFYLPAVYAFCIHGEPLTVDCITVDRRLPTVDCVYYGRWAAECIYYDRRLWDLNQYLHDTHRWRCAECSR